MDHIAIISKNWLDKILTGQKKIESRWYTNKKDPIDNIFIGDRIYFKEVGKNVNVMAKVKQVLFFRDLDIIKIKEIIDKYGKEIGIDYSYINNPEKKRYCALIFIEDVKKIDEFSINKEGYGNMAAWISVENIADIKR